MGSLTDQERELVALGASLGSNCIPCVAFHVKEALACGLSDEKIREAIDVAQKVNAVPAALVRNTAYAQLEEADGDVTDSKDASATDCGCGG